MKLPSRVGVNVDVDTSDEMFDKGATEAHCKIYHTIPTSIHQRQIYIQIVGIA